MKNIIKLLAIIFILNSNAQELNIVVPGTFKKTPDGWHKFSFQGVRYDVGINEQRLTKGNITWFDNAIYSGTFNGYDISGKGTYIWPNRERYEGSFRNNMRHGKGTMYYKDGKKHYGRWKNNVKHGRGQLYTKNGDLLKDGFWENNKFIKAVKPKKKKN